MNPILKFMQADYCSFTKMIEKKIVDEGRSSTGKEKLLLLITRITDIAINSLLGIAKFFTGMIATPFINVPCAIAKQDSPAKHFGWGETGKHFANVFFHLLSFPLYENPGVSVQVLQQTVQELQTNITDLQERIATLEENIGALEENPVGEAVLKPEQLNQITQLETKVQELEKILGEVKQSAADNLELLVKRFQKFEQDHSLITTSQLEADQKITKLHERFEDWTKLPNTDIPPLPYELSIGDEKKK